jgi:hypothetical protein
MSLRLAVHWAATTLTAGAVVTVATIPFTGAAASAVSILAAAGVCLVGLALTPTTRKERSS